MKFIVSSTRLLKELQTIGGIIQSNNTLPVLDNFLFDLQEKQLTVSASDLETTMSVKLEVESESTGLVAIPAKILPAHTCIICIALVRFWVHASTPSTTYIITKN